MSDVPPPNTPAATPPPPAAPIPGNTVPPAYNPPSMGSINPLMIGAAAAAAMLFISIFVTSLFARWYVTLPLAAIAVVCAWMYLDSGDTKGPIPPRTFYKAVVGIVAFLLIINYIRLSHNMQSVLSSAYEALDAMKEFSTRLGAPR